MPLSGPPLTLWRDPEEPTYRILRSDDRLITLSGEGLQSIAKILERKGSLHHLCQDGRDRFVDIRTTAEGIEIRYPPSGAVRKMIRESSEPIPDPLAPFVIPKPTPLAPARVAEIQRELSARLAADHDAIGIKAEGQPTFLPAVPVDRGLGWGRDPGAALFRRGGDELEVLEAADRRGGLDRHRAVR
jgi:hypothetical protein